MSHNSDYYPQNLPVPEGISTDRLYLEPLAPRHGSLDYAAVMESHRQLRVWEGGGWPADDFTLAGNLQDLQWHWLEHQQRVAFTYTVLNPQRTTCLGCVYLRPLTELKSANLDRWQTSDPTVSLVRFWLRTAYLEGDLETHLLRTLIDWLNQAWSFSGFYFETRAANRRQVEFLEAFPLVRVMTLTMPERGGDHHFYRP